MSRRKSGPSNPVDISEAAARRRALERDNPGEWGPSQQMTGRLATSDDVGITVSGGQVRARRRDVFTTMYAREAITEDQHRAAERYVEDRVAALGVRARPWPPVFSGGGGGNVAEMVTQGMIDAGRRVALAERSMGVRSVAILRSIVDRMLEGQVVGWRDLVERSSGERDPAAQAAAVRFALQDLAEVYRAWNRAAALKRDAEAVERQGATVAIC